MTPRGDLLVFEVPWQKRIDIRLSFRQLLHALDHIAVEDETVGFRCLDDPVKHRTRFSPIRIGREELAPALL